MGTLKHVRHGGKWSDNVTQFVLRANRVNAILEDFDKASVYITVHDSPDHLVQQHNAFLQQYGVPVNANSQDMPHYTATIKMHKTPPGYRYISNSATSSMQTVSVWLNRLFNALMPELDMLFADVMRSVGIDAPWTHRSWVFKNSAEVIPLIQAWKHLYASVSASSSCDPPIVEAFDFERLYTNIDTADMQSSIMELVHNIFGSEKHREKQHVGIKVCADKQPEWLKRAKMPATDQARYSETGGGSFVFDVATIEQWLQFLLHNMFVTFGGVLKRQDLGAPMGTNCASNLANFFLARYELRFVRNLAAVITNLSLNAALRSQAKLIFYASILCIYSC